MKRHQRLPQAPSDPLPEFLAPFQVHFTRRESRCASERYVTGLQLEHPIKNCETLVAALPNTNEQRLQGLLTEMAWDEADLNRQRVHVMQQLPTEGDGVLIFDDTGFAKQGKASVGVKRQYSGTLGKVANCQIAVNCTYAERTLAWLVVTRLYLPDDWANDPVRRARAHVPEDVIFQTKPELALALLDEANALGVKHRAIVADAGYGDNPSFLDGLERRKEHYVVEVRANFSVTLGRSATATIQEVSAVLKALPKRQWRSIRWKEGTQGWLRARFVAVRCWRVDGQGQRRFGWLLGQRPAPRQPGDWKYFWSNFPPQTHLSRMLEYTYRRHWVEQYHEEAKGELGWDQYQGRLWQSFHRNAVMVMLSYSFLVWLEWRERQEVRKPGRVRRAFSPAP